MKTLFVMSRRSCGTVTLYGPFIYLFFWRTGLPNTKTKQKMTIKSYGSAASQDEEEGKTGLIKLTLMENKPKYNI